MKISSKEFDLDEVEISWCPGCGNYSALKIMKEALTDLGIKPHEFVLVSGIGQAGKFPLLPNTGSWPTSTRTRPNCCVDWAPSSPQSTARSRVSPTRP